MSKREMGAKNKGGGGKKSVEYGLGPVGRAALFPNLCANLKCKEIQRAKRGGGGDLPKDNKG